MIAVPALISPMRCAMRKAISIGRFKRKELYQSIAFDFLSQLDPRITFTRPDATTCATYFGSDGLLKTAAANVPRFDYYPATPAGVTGPELATNTPLSSWNYSVWVYNADSYVDASGGVGSVFFPNTLVTGKTYKFEFISNGTVQINVVCGGAYYGFTPTVGVNTVNVVCGTATAVNGFQGGANPNNIVPLSVKEVTFAPRGLLIEESRTNLLLRSQDMTNAAWTKGVVTATKNQIGLDGTANSACLLTVTSGVPSYVSATNGVLSNSTTYTRYAIAKAGTTPNLIFEFADSGALSNTTFNLNTNAIGGTTAGAKITDLGNGVKLCERTWTTRATGVQFASNYYIDTYGTASGNNNLTLYHAQLEVGAFATSIIPTAATAVTRAADSAVTTGTNFSSWYNQSAGTFVVEALAGYSNSTQVLLSLDDGTNSNKIVVYRLANGTVIAEWFVGGVTQAALFSLNVASGNLFKIAFSWRTNDFAMSINGSAAVTDTSGTIPTVASMRIGGNTGNISPWNATIRRQTYYPMVANPSQLQALASL